MTNNAIEQELLSAASTDAAASIVALLERGAKVDAVNENGSTPLMIASFCGNTSNQVALFHVSIELADSARGTQRDGDASASQIPVKRGNHGVRQRAEKPACECHLVHGHAHDLKGNLHVLSMWEGADAEVRTAALEDHGSNLDLRGDVVDRLAQVFGQLWTYRVEVRGMSERYHGHASVSVPAGLNVRLSAPIGSW